MQDKRWKAKELSEILSLCHNIRCLSMLANTAVSIYYLFLPFPTPHSGCYRQCYCFWQRVWSSSSAQGIGTTWGLWLLHGPQLPQALHRVTYIHFPPSLCLEPPGHHLSFSFCLEVPWAPVQLHFRGLHPQCRGSLPLQWPDSFITHPSRTSVWPQKPQITELECRLSLGPIRQQHWCSLPMDQP